MESVGKRWTGFKSVPATLKGKASTPPLAKTQETKVSNVKEAMIGNGEGREVGIGTVIDSPGRVSYLHIAVLVI